MKFSHFPLTETAFTAAVITLSDKGADGLRVDESGPAAVSLLSDAGYRVIEAFLIPDEPKELKHHLIRLSDSRQTSLILTLGGTGFSPRDTTPEAPWLWHSAMLPESQKRSAASPCR